MVVNIAWIDTHCSQDELNRYLFKYPNTKYFIITK